jgi:hypothetical protein
MYSIKFEKRALTVATIADLDKNPWIRRGELVHLGDWNRRAKGLYISASMTRGELYEMAGFDVNKIDFAVPTGFHNPEKRSVWSYERKSTFGEQVFDTEAQWKLADLVVDRILQREGVEYLD